MFGLRGGKFSVAVNNLLQDALFWGGTVQSWEVALNKTLLSMFPGRKAPAESFRAR